MLGITSHKGFHVEFANRVCVSVQFGLDNYCDHYTSDERETRSCFNHYLENPHGQWLSSDAEIAIIGPKKWLTKEWRPELSDDVAGYCTPADVLDAMNWASNYKEDNL